MMAQLQIISDGINFSSRKEKWQQEIFEYCDLSASQPMNYSTIFTRRWLCSDFSFITKRPLTYAHPTSYLSFATWRETFVDSSFSFISIRSALDMRKASRCLPYHKTYWHGSWEKGRRNNEKAHEKLYHRLSTEWQQGKAFSSFSLRLFCAVFLDKNFSCVV